VILLIILLILVFGVGGGGSYYGYNHYGMAGGLGPIALIMIAVALLYLFGILPRGGPPNN
jgi:hypothetical protein